MTDRQRLLNLIDHAAACRCHATLFSDVNGEPLAEEVFRAWADTHGYQIETNELIGPTWDRSIQVNVRPSTRIMVFCGRAA